jgi:hypothetical protein
MWITLLNTNSNSPIVQSNITNYYYNQMGINNNIITHSIQHGMLWAYADLMMSIKKTGLACLFIIIIVTLFIALFAAIIIRYNYALNNEQQ